MSKLYVPDGALTACLSGKNNSNIVVTSQQRVKINGKLKATEEDRFKDNFYCQKMTFGASVLGSMTSATLGAMIGGPAGAFVGFLAGKFAGALLGNTTHYLPSLCSTLCKPSRWTVVHPKTRIEGKRALLENAQIRCMLGGTVNIILPDMDRALLMAQLASDAYKSREDSEKVGDFEKVSDERAEEILGENWGKLLDQDKKNGFYAGLYEDGNGNVVIAYRGTDPGAGINDIKEDYVQAMGLSSDQYDAATKLAQKVQESKNKGAITGTVEITGHSLGGGLATIGGTATGYPTYTYNAAAVPPDTYKRNGVDPNNSQHILAYIGTQDPLNMTQDNREAILSGGVLAAPIFPVLGTAIGSLGHTAGPLVGGITTATGAVGGSVLGGALAGSGMLGLIKGGLPRQENVQRISVLQDRTFGTGHGIGEMVDDLTAMQAKQAKGKPVKALQEVEAGTLSRKEIIEDQAQEKWNQAKQELEALGKAVREKAVETADKVEEIGNAGIKTGQYFKSKFFD